MCYYLSTAVTLNTDTLFYYLSQMANSITNSVRSGNFQECKFENKINVTQKPKYLIFKLELKSM
jgi:hypothetical protein